MTLDAAAPVAAVVYRLRPVDLWRFTVFVHFQSIVNRILAALSMFLVVPAFTSLLAQTVRTNPASAPVVLVVGVVTLWPVLLPLVGWAGAVSAFRNRPELGSEHRMEIGPEGLLASSGIGETRVSWKGICSIREDRWNVYLMIDRRTAYIVPKRAFTDPEDCRRFVDEARRMWRNAGYLPVSTTRAPAT